MGTKNFENRCGIPKFDKMDKHNETISNNYINWEKTATGSLVNTLTLSMDIAVYDAWFSPQSGKQHEMSSTASPEDF